MSATDGKSTVCVRPKRKRPMLETNDGELHESPSNHADDFPTAFNFRSNRHVRRRLCTQLADFPRPDSAMAAQSRKKRKAYMSQHSRVLRWRLADSSSSIHDKDASSSHTAIPTNGHSHDSYAMLNDECYLRCSIMAAHQTARL